MVTPFAFAQAPHRREFAAAGFARCKIDAPPWGVQDPQAGLRIGVSAAAAAGSGAAFRFVCGFLATIAAPRRTLLRNAVEETCESGPERNVQAGGGLRAKPAAS